MAAGMTDARSSMRMNMLRRSVSTMCALVARVVGWCFSTVEDETPRNVIALPGPAHGPVPAIDLRMEQRRKAS
jgi:hypothetical protein